MNGHTQAELWFKIRLVLAFLGLGFASALIAVTLSNPFPQPWKSWIRIIVFLAGFYIIEIKVEKTPRGEEDP